ncbi:hypothetical protein DPMN_138856 [Dreissena polymorpha]|uniref:C1q domain-containing protein n=1 Tax=Dreissena polymorpha TaxID=45954 RepID=A0A9D4G828_DREPO|nr:hypothetical protein DPMN_138856 [Dreissena polymorpha]
MVCVSSRTGTYSFSSSLSSIDVFRVNLVLKTVTNVIGYLYEDNPNGFRHESTSIVTHLTAGDDVWVACVPGTASNIDGGHGGLHSHFSGFLVD